MCTCDCVCVYISFSLLIRFDYYFNSNWTKVELDRLKYQNARNLYHTSTRSMNECWKKTAGFDDDNKKPVCAVAVPVSGDCKRMKKLLYLHLQSSVVWTMKRNGFNTRSSIASGEGYFAFTPLPSTMFVHFDLLNEFFTFTCSSITKQTNECIETNDPNRIHTASKQITTDPVRNYQMSECEITIHYLMWLENNIFIYSNDKIVFFIKNNGY